MKNKKFIFISTIDDLRPVFSPEDNICEYSGLELSQIITESGYHVVSLNTKEGKRIQRRVHRLGMYTFSYFPGCEKYQVDHKDGNKDNNDITTNLEWVLPKENINRAINIGLRKSWKADNNPQSKKYQKMMLELYVIWF